MYYTVYVCELWQQIQNPKKEINMNVNFSNQYNKHACQCEFSNCSVA